MKYKEKIFKIAKETKIAGLKRSYDYNNALFVSCFVAFLLLFIEIFRDIISKNWFIVLIDILILISLVILIYLSSIRKGKIYVALIIREEKKHNSKKEAYKIIDEFVGEV